MSLKKPLNSESLEARQLLVGNLACTDPVLYYSATFAPTTVTIGACTGFTQMTAVATGDLIGVEVTADSMIIKQNGTPDANGFTTGFELQMNATVTISGSSGNPASSDCVSACSFFGTVPAALFGGGASGWGTTTQTANFGKIYQQAGGQPITVNAFVAQAAVGGPGSIDSVTLSFATPTIAFATCVDGTANLVSFAAATADVALGLTTLTAPASFSTGVTNSTLDNSGNTNQFMLSQSEFNDWASKVRAKANL